MVRRATLLADVGLGDEARERVDGGRRPLGDDAPRLAELARLAQARGSTYAALKAAERLAGLAPAGAAAPAALDRLIYPAPYPALVAQEAAERGLDPRLLYALMRQESLFDPGATSWVGARGLAQVMPETGQGIAQSLGVSDFSPDDLYRPAVSVRFGAFYLRTRLGDMGGSVQAALSAYNGGSGTPSAGPAAAAWPTPTSSPRGWTSPRPGATSRRCTGSTPRTSAYTRVEEGLREALTLLPETLPLPRGGSRQDDGEHAALAEEAAHRDLAAVGVDHMAHDGEAEAAAGLVAGQRAVDLVEGQEHLLQALGGDADAAYPRRA